MKPITVQIGDRTFEVPAGVTVIQALWITGHALVRGIGCLGGVCGACTFTFRRKGAVGVSTGLACQTLVEPGMSFSLPASIAVDRRRHPLDGEQAPRDRVLAAYPETRRCTRCNACTQVCPQQIDVRACVVKALEGDFATVSELFYDCVMCGLCAAVCDVSIKPNLVALYARRIHGASQIGMPGNLERRLEEIAGGKFRDRWEAVQELDEAGLATCRLD